MLALTQVILRTDHSSRAGNAQAVPTSQQLSFVIYLVLTVLSTIGFVFFFDDAIVAVTGLIAMGGSLIIIRRNRRQPQAIESAA